MARLPMPAGLLIEAAFAEGFNGEELLRILQQKNLQALSSIGKEDTSWQYLFQFTEENNELIKEAIYDGFSFKFLSIRGLQNLIITAFSLKENVDFIQHENYLELDLTEQQLHYLVKRVPTQWEFIKQKEESNWGYRAVLALDQAVRLS